MAKKPNPADPYRDRKNRIKTIEVTLDHQMYSMGRTLIMMCAGGNDRGYGISPSAVGMPVAQGMRYRVTFELIAPSKTVRPRKNPWSHIKVADAAEVAEDAALHRSLTTMFKSERKACKA